MATSTRNRKAQESRGSDEVAVTIRLPRDLVAILKTLARQNTRSVKGEVEHRVRKSLESA